MLYRTVLSRPVPYRDLLYHVVSCRVFCLNFVRSITLLCRTAPCRTVPCLDIPYRTIPCRTVPYRSMLYHTYLCYTIRTVPYHALTYCTVPHRAVPYRVMLYHTVPYYPMPYRTISYHTTTVPCRCNEEIGGTFTFYWIIVLDEPRLTWVGLGWVGLNPNTVVDCPADNRNL